MKLRSSSPLNLLRSCALITVANFTLFQIMASTHMIEKFMAFSFQWWEMILILLFLAFRLAAYLIVPPALIALVAYVVSGKIARRSSTPKP